VRWLVQIPGKHGDDVEYQLGCNRVMDENIRAVCSVPIAYCPPVNVMTRSTFAASSESADDQIDDTIPAGTVLLLVAAIVLVLAIAIAVAVKSGWDYKKWLFGADRPTADEAIASDKVEPKEKTEKDKIMEQYRAASYRDISSSKQSEQGHPIAASELSSKSMSALPGSIDHSDHLDFGDDNDQEDVHTLTAAKRATAAASQRERQVKRSNSQDKASRVRSSGSQRSKATKPGSSSMKPTVRSPSSRRRDSRSDTNTELRSKSLAPRKRGAADKDKESGGHPSLRSASEGSRRRTAMQHNLKVSTTIYSIVTPREPFETELHVDRQLTVPF
jgi:hypothetical protein